LWINGNVAFSRAHEANKFAFMSVVGKAFNRHRVRGEDEIRTSGED
jgi:hypothetical protein